MNRVEFFSRAAGRDRLHSLRQRPLAAIASRALQLVMLICIVAVGLLSLSLVLVAAMLFGLYALLRQRSARRAGNFRIQFANIR